MAYLDKRHIRSRARELLEQFGHLAAPVRVERLAKDMDIIVRYEALQGELSGMAFVKDGAKFIVVNALHHPNRQRFTVAHEIGHHVLHPEKLDAGVHVDKLIMRRDVVSAAGTDDFEIQANIFASELLMPRDLMMAAIGGGVDLDEDKVLQRLAKHFKVSLAALQFRLAALND